MAKKKKLISVILVIAVLILAPPAANCAQAENLTIEAAVNSSYNYSLIDEKIKLMQKEWTDRLNSSKSQVNGIDKLIELDDKIIKIKKYLDEENYRSMRIDIVRDDFADFLLMYGHINYMEALIIKAGLIESDAYKKYTEEFYNNDQIIREYYEFQLKYMPDNLPDKDRINMLSAKESSVSQVEALIKQEKVKLEAQTEKLRMDVVKTYTDLIMGQKSLDNARNNEEESQKVADKYKNLLDHGMISSLDYKEAQTELENKKNEVMKAERVFDKYKTNLNILMGKDENNNITIDQNISAAEVPDISYSSLQEQLEKENINLYVLRETVVDPAVARFKIAGEELKPEDDLYKDIQDEKDKAEMEYAQTLDKYKTAVIQQIRAIRDTQNTSIELQGEIALMDQRISLLKSQIKAGFATDLDLLKLQNAYNTLKTNMDNLKYALDYQWQNLQYTVHY